MFGLPSWLKRTRALLKITSTQGRDSQIIKLKEDKLEIRRALDDEKINQKVIRLGTFVKIGPAIVFHHTQRSVPTKPSILEWDYEGKTYKIDGRPLQQKEMFMKGDFIFEYEKIIE